jgi:hypothetical protein
VTSGIYGIQDTDREHWVYVGRSFNIERRTREHHKEIDSVVNEILRDYREIRKPITTSRRNCLAYLTLQGVPWEVEVFEELSEDRWLQEEQEVRWASFLLEAGHPLSNGTAAGTHLSGWGARDKKNDCPYTPELNGSTSLVFLLDIPTIRRLKRDRKDLAEKVISGDMSANAAAIEAGFRKKTLTIPADIDGAARVLLKHFDPDELYEAVVSAKSDATARQRTRAGS